MRLLALLTTLGMMGLLGYSIYSTAIVAPVQDTAATVAGQTPGMPVSDVATQPADSGVEPLRQLPGWHLFGRPVAGNKPAVKKPAVPVRTRLNLTLKGIVNADTPNTGWAIIANASGKEQHFTVADEIFGLATLNEIHGDRVILSRNGRQEELLLARKPIELTAPKAARTAAKPIRPPVSGARSAVRGSALDGFMKAFKYENAISPDGGDYLGLRLVADEVRSMVLLKTVGLASGDIITHVDGVPLGRTAGKNGLRHRLSNKKVARLTVLRGEGTVQISLPVPR